MGNGACINKGAGELDNEGSCYANEELKSVVEHLFIRNPRSVSLFNMSSDRVGHTKRGVQEDTVHSLLMNESINVSFRCEEDSCRSYRSSAVHGFRVCVKATCLFAGVFSGI